MDFIQPSATLQQQRFLYGLVSCIGLACAIIYWQFFSPPFFPLDDAYIVLHNAQVLRQGFDHNYPHVSALYGSTSLVHLALVTLLSLCMPLNYASLVIGWLAYIAYALGLLRLTFLYRASILQALFFCAMGVLIAYVFFHMLAGLETGLMLAVFIWTLTFFIQQSSNKIIANVLAGTLPFLRPELAIFSLLTIVLQAEQLWQTHKNSRLLGKELLKIITIQLLAAAPWLIWYWWSLGIPIPATINAKYLFFSRDYPSLIVRLDVIKLNLLRFAYAVGFLTILGMVIFSALTPIGIVGLIFILIVIFVYTVSAPYVLNFNMQRYCYIFLPVLLAGLASALQHKDKTVRTLANLLLILALLQSAWNFIGRWQEYSYFYPINKLELTSLADWCEKNLPEQSTIAVQDAGFLAYQTHFHLIDFVGLKTPTSVLYHRQITFPSHGDRRIQAISQILHDSHAQYLIITVEWNDALGIISGLQRLGWQVQWLRGNNQRGYLVYHLTPPASMDSANPQSKLQLPNYFSVS